MIRQAETHAYCLWRACHAMRQPIIDADQRNKAARLLWDIARFGATPKLKLRATEALKRCGFVAQHSPMIGGGPDAA